MQTYQYTDSSNRVVNVIDADGVSRKSCLAASLPAGSVILPALPQPQEEVISMFVVAAQRALDKQATDWGYDSMLTAISYVNSNSVKFRNEAVALNRWRDELWNTAITVQNAVIAGTQPAPGSPDAFVALLPAPPFRPV